MFKKLLTVTLCFVGTAGYSLKAKPHDHNADFFSSSLVASIASGDEDQVFDHSSVIYVFNEEDIKRSQKIYLYDLLATIPGVQINSSALIRMAPSISIRGTRTNINPHVLFLENGFEIKSIFTGAPLSNYNPILENVEKIEVSIGPSSVLFGDTAYAGVVNITKKNTSDKIMLTSGSFNSSALFASKVFELSGDSTLGLSYEVSKSDGDKDRIVTYDVQSNLDDSFGTNLSNAPGSMNTEQTSKSFLAQLQKDLMNIQYSFKLREYGTGVGILQSINDISDESIESHTLSMSNNVPLSHTSEVNWKLHYLNEVRQGHFTMLPAGAIVPLNKFGHAVADPNLITHFATFSDGYIGNPYNKFETYSLDIELLTETSQNFKHLIKTGFSHKAMTSKETKNFGPTISDFTKFIEANGNLIVSSDDIMDVTETDYLFNTPYSIRNNYYLASVHEYQLDKLITTLGFRVDYITDLNDYYFSPRMSLLYKASQKNAFKLGLSKAYRAPSFSELYSKNNPQVIGNENLDAENISSVDFSYIWTVNTHGELRVNLYYNIESNLIVAADTDGPKGNTLNIYKNLAETKTFGQEIFFQYELGEDTFVNTSFTHFRKDYENFEDAFLPNYDHLFKVGLITKFEDFDIAVNYTGASGISGSGECSCDTSLKNLNFDAKYTINENGELTFGINNLFNHRSHMVIEKPIGYVPNKGRYARVGLRYSF